MPTNAPLPGQFEEDPRVSFDKVAGKWHYEEDDQEFEWTGQAWIPLISEDDWQAQQRAYAVEGVDENTPANAVVAREERRGKKRKKEEKPKPEPSAPKKTGVWVTNLPPDATEQKIANVFSKAGVLMIGDDGEPRVKMYYKDGKFTGEALVMYFKEGSVALAITLLDETELEMGAGFGNMRVQEASYAKPDTEVKPEQEKKKYTAEDKLKMTKRIRRMQDKITWHSDDESDEEGPAGLTAPPPMQNRFQRVVVLKGMFDLKDLEKDPGLLIDLKEDVREEAESCGQVTSVVLYDKEEDGVMTVKFKDALAAQACVVKMSGRYFDGRRIYAGIYTGKERFQRSGHSDEGEEKERLESFASWLVDGDDSAEANGSEESGADHNEAEA